MKNGALTVLQVNAADVGGGAERVMLDLHHEYLRRGIDSWIAVDQVRHPDERTLHIDNDAARSAWTRRLKAIAQGESPASTLNPFEIAMLVAADPVRYRRILSGREDYDFPATGAIIGLPPRQADVLHLHNLHGYYFDLRMLPELAAGTPTLITMHDTWLLTGHCVHPFDCTRWRTGCGECPTLGTYVPIRRDASAENRALKRDLIERAGVALAVPSRWLMRMAEDSGLGASNEMRVIPNGVDTRVFRPGDKDEARAALSIPREARVLLVVANKLAANPFKDYRTLLEALSIVGAGPAGPVELIALGTDEVPAVPGVHARAIKYVDDKSVVVSYYRAADIYVHAALAENLPLTPLEAMACGTAVVASDVGGMSEVVADGIAGTLVPPSDAAALAAAITTLLDDAQMRGSMGDAGARAVAERFTLTGQADAYLAWYDELLAKG
jgi:glycosyltransferase involved in cell wall biosynthesis